MLVPTVSNGEKKPTLIFVRLTALSVTVSIIIIIHTSKNVTEGMN